jgi:hypothetical protein
MSLQLYTHKEDSSIVGAVLVSFARRSTSPGRLVLSVKYAGRKRKWDLADFHLDTIGRHVVPFNLQDYVAIVNMNTSESIRVKTKLVCPDSPAVEATALIVFCNQRRSFGCFCFGSSPEEDDRICMTTIGDADEHIRIPKDWSSSKIFPPVSLR